MESVITVREGTDVAEVRRTAHALAAQLGFTEVETGNLGLIVTEAARNLLKHAGHGDVALRTLGRDGTVGIEMLALDRGPGMHDVTRSFADGYSTAGTAGNGLGAIVRMSTLYDVYSRPREGTALMAQLWKSGRVPPAGPAFRVGAVSRPVAGESECGDAWLFEDRVSGGRLVVVDGLGHGPHAAAAARAAVDTARERPQDGSAALLERIHGALRSTRGAAVAVAEVDASVGLVRFAGIGNISGAILPPANPVRRMVSHAGIAGHEVRRISEFTYPWEPGALLLMHSDGLSSKWTMESYPGLSSRHPSLIAGVLYRDFSRERDDATVVAAGGTSA